MSGPLSLRAAGEAVRSVLRESLGVTDYLNSAPDRCDRSSAPFTPLTPGLTGWRIGKLLEDDIII